MKRMDFFCASPASTAVCSSMDQRSIIPYGKSKSQNLSNGRHHRLGDPQRPYHPSLLLPCSSSSQNMPINPKPYYQQKCNKSSVGGGGGHELRRKSCADIEDARRMSSSKHLLRDAPFFEFLSDSVHYSELVPAAKCNAALADYRRHDQKLMMSSSSTNSLKLNNFPSSKHSVDKVVVLKVSLHCKGCERKVRKHISKMEGVTSFSTDLATKKVTIIGNVSPSEVVSSVSKVKYAQLWSSPSSSSSSSSSSSATSTVIKLRPHSIQGSSSFHILGREASL